jgi:glycosyltransferase involved in cell wall biosynthesis
MTKILFILDGLRSGGKERRFISLLKQLSSKEEFNCMLVLFNEDIHFEEVRNFGISIRIINRKAAKDIRPFVKLYNIYQEFKPDIIHAWDNLSTIFALPIVALSKSKLITSRINHVPNNYKKFTLFGLQAELGFVFSSVVLSNSKAGAIAYRAPKKKTEVIYNGFDLDRLKYLKDKQSIRNQFNIKEKTIVGMVASFTNMKDYASFLYVADKISKSYKDIAFVCVGDGLLRESLEKKYTKNRNIYFLGRQTDIESIVNVFDVGVLCTITEGISNTVMEYMALKKPVIVTGGGGTVELIEHNNTGFIFDAYDRVNLQMSILKLLNNNELSNSFGEKGYYRIVDLFSIQKMLEGFENVYKRLSK